MIWAARESEVPFVGGKIGGDRLGGMAGWHGGGKWGDFEAGMGWGDGDAPKSPLFVSRFALSVAEMGRGEEEAAEGQVL